MRRTVSSLAMTFIEASLLLVVFGCTLLMLALHPLEWFKIRAYRQTTRRGIMAYTGLAFLKRGLGLETCYYILVLVFLIAFYRELFLFIAVLVMAIAHVAASRDISHTPSTLRNNRHLAGMFAFDVLELIFLLFLTAEFWPLILPVL